MAEPMSGTRWPTTTLDIVASYLAVHGAFNLTAATPWRTTLTLFAAIAGISLTIGVVSRVMARRDS